MTLQPMLKSRFGRRLLLLFVGCAVVPISVVAAVSYRHVTQQLRAQSESRLHQANKVLGLAIFERLLLLDATLKSIPPHALFQLKATRIHQRSGSSAQRPVADFGDNEAGRGLIAGLDLLARRRFVALEFVEQRGTRTPIFGHLESLPILSASDSSDLSYGLPLLTTERRAALPSRIYLLRRVDRRGGARGTLIGEVSPEFLWGTVDQSMPSATTMVVVMDE
ncbi:MAG: hypothetical protein H0T90_04600, partial [Gemmatimonadales bacterium]|nr:hypothetical protein [Gemmatimonadales bacterium]